MCIRDSHYNPQQLPHTHVSVSYTHLDVYKRQIYNWCEQNRLQVSIAKTKCMLLKRVQLRFRKATRRAETHRPPTVKIKGQPVRYFKEYRYLDNILDEMLSFVNHLKYVADTATKIF